jgi:predicted CoA-binding protein
MSHEHNLVEDEARIGDIVRAAKRVAVLGIKTERQADQPAFYVAQFLKAHGAQIVPVPVYYPDVTEILGEKVYRSLAEIPGPVDLVDVFRRPSDISAHVEDMKKLRPRVVWFQLGIRNDAAARELAAAGLLVVQNRCLKVEWALHRGRR